MILSLSFIGLKTSYLMFLMEDFFKYKLLMKNEVVIII